MAIDYKKLPVYQQKDKILEFAMAKQIIENGDTVREIERKVKNKKIKCMLPLEAAHR